MNRQSRSRFFAVVACLLATVAVSACDPDAPQDFAAGDALMHIDRPGEAGYAVHTVCGSGTVTYGIDVSHWQGVIDWDTVAGSSLADFAYIRTGDGLNTDDSQFDYNWREAGRVGMLRGAYQFFRPSQDAFSQAQDFVDTINASGGMTANDLPPMLDMETMSGQTTATVQAAMQTWLDYVELETGKRPIIYTGSYFWDDNSLGSGFTSYPLWTAHYTGAACPLIPDAWDEWTIWQFSDTGTVAGVSGPCDENRFNGSYMDLLAWADSGSTGTAELSIVDLSMAPTVTRGQSARIDYQVRNAGTAAASSFILRLRLSPDVWYNLVDELVCDAVITNLAAGATRSDFIDCVIPNAAPLGPQYLVGSADAFGDIPEGNENDNFGSTPVTVDDGAVVDADGDGDPEGSDCDDTDPNVYTGAPERCDGVDTNCDGTTPASEIDNDGDGYAECDDPGDCDDADAAVNPGAADTPNNGIDENCDGVDLTDSDGDGWDVPADCDDTDPAIHPGVPESSTCDGIDNNCDGRLDEGNSCFDHDGDGFSADDGDCADLDADIFPGAAEQCDGIDTDCDGTADPSTCDGGGSSCSQAAEPAARALPGALLFLSILLGLRRRTGR